MTTDEVNALMEKARAEEREACARRVESFPPGTSPRGLAREIRLRGVPVPDGERIVWVMRHATDGDYEMDDLGHWRRFEDHQSALRHRGSHSSYIPVPVTLAEATAGAFDPAKEAIRAGGGRAKARAAQRPLKDGEGGCVPAAATAFFDPNAVLDRNGREISVGDEMYHPGSHACARDEEKALRDAEARMNGPHSLPPKAKEQCHGCGESFDPSLLNSSGHAPWCHDCFALLPTIQWVVTSSAPRVAEALIAAKKSAVSALERPSAQDWDVKVLRRGAYRRCVFRVGVQHFTLASGSGDEARQHVHFIKKMFLQALARLGVTPEPR